MGPRKQPKYHQPAMVAQLRDPPGKPSKIMMFQAWPQATKSHQNWSQSHRKPCKNDTKIDIIPTYVKSCFLQYLPHQMLDSGAPDIQIQTPKSLKNVTCKHACQKTQLLRPIWHLGDHRAMQGDLGAHRRRLWESRLGFLSIWEGFRGRHFDVFGQLWHNNCVFWHACLQVTFF